MFRLDFWLHVFDFHGIRSATGAFPPVAHVASENGSELETVHHGFRAVLARSAFWRAAPALRAMYPGAVALSGDSILRFADLPQDPVDLAIPHSIVALTHPSRPALRVLETHR